MHASTLQGTDGLAEAIADSLAAVEPFSLLSEAQGGGVRLDAGLPGGHAAIAGRHVRKRWRLRFSRNRTHLQRAQQSENPPTGDESQNDDQHGNEYSFLIAHMERKIAATKTPCKSLCAAVRGSHWHAPAASNASHMVEFQSDVSSNGSNISPSESH